MKRALQQVHQLIEREDYVAAEQQGREILRRMPDDPHALFITASAMRHQGKFKDARSMLKKAVDGYPSFALAHQELAIIFCNLRDFAPAIASFQQAVHLDPELALSWKTLSELLLANGEEQASDKAFYSYLRASLQYPILRDALHALADAHPAQAATLCQRHLGQFPDDVHALRILAEAALQMNAPVDAERHLQRCLELEPDFHLARLNYVHTLKRLNKDQAALTHLEILEKAEPNKVSHQIVKASLLDKMGQVDRAIDLYDDLIARFPKLSSLYNNRGHALKTVGRNEEAIASYRKAIELSPRKGGAYWSLANLKTFRFERAEIRAMWELVTGNKLSTGSDRASICFALGKALDDADFHDYAFKFYYQGNELMNQMVNPDAGKPSAAVSRLIDRIIQVCDRGFFSESVRGGCQKPDPIFIVGLPRSGSTLLEQILASHSLVDGTEELPDIPALAKMLGGRQKAEEATIYPVILRQLTDEQLQDLGAEYLARTRPLRGSAPFFIDKRPDNFIHIGFIRKILPNAKIIDARRHPMATGFSCYKQLFASGQTWTYKLREIGEYYLSYIRMMDHWHAVQPGKVLTVHYEKVIQDFESQVRDLLTFCQLPFEQDCLEFHKSERAVRTASSAQVRQPLNEHGLEAWRPYEKQLKPLSDVLRPLLDTL
jgi:tetratricopeptide (TPR) repeat protein